MQVYPIHNFFKKSKKYLKTRLRSTLLHHVKQITSLLFPLTSCLLKYLSPNVGLRETFSLLYDEESFSEKAIANSIYAL